MLIHTEGVILRNVKYGETSIIISIFTLARGKVSFIIKGVRQTKTRNNPNLYSIGQRVEISYVHREHKSLQYLTSCTALRNSAILIEDITRHCIYLFCIEVTNQLLLEDQPNEPLYEWFIDTIDLLQKKEITLCANYPIFFLKIVADINGYSIQNNYSQEEQYLDLYNGKFSSLPFGNQKILDEHLVHIFTSFIAAQEYDAVANIPMHHHDRNELIEVFIQFLQIHSPNFKELKSLPVLAAILR